MITKTSLTHPRTQQQLLSALRAAVALPSCAQHLHSRDGQPFLGVVYLQGELSYAALGRSSGFFFYDARTAEDLTDAVHSVMREVGA